MEILEESAEYDPEIASLLDGVEGNPKAVEDRIRERFDKKKEKVYQEREGSTVPMMVKFDEFKSALRRDAKISARDVSDRALEVVFSMVGPGSPSSTPPLNMMLMLAAPELSMNRQFSNRASVSMAQTAIPTLLLAFVVKVQFRTVGAW